jgi:hypothetical protein
VGPRVINESTRRFEGFPAGRALLIVLNMDMSNMILNQIFPMEFFMADWTRRVFLAMTQQMILEGCFVAEKFWTLVTAKFVEVALELRIFG